MHHLILILVDLILFNSFILYPIEAKSNSFSFDLIHRDSKLSPFYNHSMFPSKAVNPSLDRLHHFNSSVSFDAKKTVKSHLTPGDYFMKYDIGELGTNQLAIPDMGSDLIWLRCAPCKGDCENQHTSLYNPESSKTYRNVPFGTDNCNYLKGTKGDSDTCRYNYPLNSDGLYSSGVLATEDFYFNNEEKFSDIVFGCDDAHQGDFEEGVKGFVGLGQGKLSLVSQLGKEEGSKKFSYCLVQKSESSASSKIIFGSDATINHEDETVFKARVTHDPFNPHYFLHLESITVNDEKIKALRTTLDMVVNIQKSLTTLPENIYNELLTKVIKEAGAGNLEKEINRDYGNTCFLKTEFQEIKAKLPKIVFRYTKAEGFDGVADFHINPKTLFEPYGDYMCLTIAPHGVVVLGNQAQVDKQMLFDLSSHSLSFAPLDCNNFST